MDRTVSPAPVRIGRRDALDGVRAVAVFLVLARHAGVPGVPGGGSTIFVFFTLSGFLITTLLLQEVATRGSIDLLRFTRRRLRRLAPHLLLVVSLVSLAGVVRPDVVPHPVGRQVLEVLLYCANWVRASGGSVGLFEHTWSLAVEEQFYLLWPVTVLVAVTCAGRRRAAVAVVAVSVAGILFSLLERWVLFRHGASLGRVYNGSDTEADSLLMGAVAAAVLQLASSSPDSPDRQVLRRVASRATVPVLVLYLLVLLLQPLPGRPAGTELFFTLGITLVAAGTALLVLHLVLSPECRSARVLSLRPLPVLGRLSYGVYLWHFPIFIVLAGRLPGRPFLVLLLGGGLALILAAAGRVLVERPLHAPGSA